ncbi:MAG TPA: radical SAM protein [Deltaproteobacteria bacterium]|nr:radical SAM protein [Deltaproteobacteria bacterium]
MEQLKDKEHDFSAKLRQRSVIENLKKYILWERGRRGCNRMEGLPSMGPVSINLDLTSACNFSCPHCVDSGIINTGEALNLDTIRHSIDTLVQKGLLSVILIGGGEPTVHPDFEEVVRYCRGRSLQVGIVTNGSRLERVAAVADLLQEGDWLRLSIDAAREETFYKAHLPGKNVTLKKILTEARQIKQDNPKISLGYSYVIVWEGIFMNGKEICPNIEEINEAVELAGEYDFDYISFKPCLLRLDGSKKESLFSDTDAERENSIIQRIRENLAKAKHNAQVAILESVNLHAMMDRKVHELKRQPNVCHSQFFRTVLAPSGVFHCPAYRGVAKGRIAGSDGYKNLDMFDKTHGALDKSIRNFDAGQECNVVVCFYHHVNWWIERFISSGESVDNLEVVEDNNFFL